MKDDGTWAWLVVLLALGKGAALVLYALAVIYCGYVIVHFVNKYW